MLAIASKARKEKPAGQRLRRESQLYHDKGRFEVLAASAKGVLTPEPGKHSFTAFLLRELRGRIEEGVTVRDLAGILSENDKITATPYYVDLARTKATSTPIKKLKVTLDPRFMRKPSGYLMFRVSLTDDLTGRQIADWLKTAPPESVTAVNIEAVVTKARRLQKNLSSEAFPPGSLLSKLPLHEQQLILRELQSLNTTMSATAGLEQDQLMQADKQSISDDLQPMKYRVLAPRDDVQEPVPSNLEGKDVGKMDPSIADSAGTTEAASLRSLLIREKAITKSLELDIHSIRDIDSSKRFGTGLLNDRQVLTEFFDFAEDPETGNPYDETVQQLINLTAVLCHSKGPRYHILPCVGYVHDKLTHTFGLVFEPPLLSNLEKGPTTLHQMFDLEPFVPLGHRFRLAHALSVALESFHRIEWVHKEIRSDNLAFMPLATASDSGIPGSQALAGDVDLAAPWLFGFEYARAEAAGTLRDEDHNIDNNLYRHPDLWGKPQVDFTKAHDIYSLGIILYEIAVWENIKATLKFQDRQRISSYFIRAMEIMPTLDNINIPMVVMLTTSILFLVLLQVFSRHRGEALEVTQLFVYPVKGLRGCSLQNAPTGPYGLLGDRVFCLQRVYRDKNDPSKKRHETMFIGYNLELALFSVTLNFGGNGHDLAKSEVVVTWNGLNTDIDLAKDVHAQDMARFPLKPSIEGRDEFEVSLHKSPTKAYDMGDDISSWFTERLAFNDIAHYLVVTEESNDDVTTRLEDDCKMDIRKFRPNIVVKGASGPFVEDFWGELTFESGILMPLTANCYRCQSITVDYNTGKTAADDRGTVWKKLNKYRRVDQGAKYSPVFGRYGYCFGSSPKDNFRLAQLSKLRC
ncbi:MOSC domain-containing protein [Lasiodiplodia theobromae]|uniref:MOSC domain-containing protein n=1 Tax=Lasiodiplodia theobromae TaxID=45133 RepID=UPI0015C3182A|nr:MOSC domain-containing protein [Lasiodiplodia theobromae]KAF4536934.1 MOSC domain-containing protein [Lasiodiplodia theobromae]